MSRPRRPHEADGGDDRDRQLLKRLLSMTTSFPPTFRSWLVDYVSNEATLTQAQVVNVVHQDWTPSLTASGSLNIGSTGTAIGRFIRIGTFIHATAEILFGGSGVDGGSSNWVGHLPVRSADNSNSGHDIGGWQYRRGDTTLAQGRATQAGNLGVTFPYPSTWPFDVETLVGGSDPWTPIATDRFYFSLMYETVLTI